MRLKYYTLSLRQMNPKKAFVFFLLIMIIALPIYVYSHNIKPVLKTVCESNAKNICVKASNNAVYEYIKNVKYQDLIDVEKDNNNRVTAITADVMEMNRISNNVTTKLEEELANYTSSEIVLPLGVFVGSQLFAGYGPKINIQTLPVGELGVKFKSEFTAAGINQTKHRIVIEVTAYVQNVAPFFTENQSYTNDILVAESIIVGDVPQAYYEIQGVEGLSQKETLNLINGN